MKQLFSLLALQLCSILPLAAILDTNTNGLSDVWEKQHNTLQLFTPSNPTHAPTADPDQDGWTNAQEALAGTHPFSANGVNGKTRVTIAAAAQAATHELTWPVIPGKNYRVQASTNLQFWVNIGSIIKAEAAETTHTIALQATDPENPNSTSPPPRLFYRVKILDRDEDNDLLTTAEEFALGLNAAAINTLASINDLWLATHFLDSLLTIGLTAVAANPDSDTDGLSLENEQSAGTDPNKSDTDNDTINDSEDADPLDPIINWRFTGRPNFAVIEIPVTNANELHYFDHSINGTIMLGREASYGQAPAVIISKEQHVREIPYTQGNLGADEGIWLHHLQNDLAPAMNNIAGSSDSLYDPITTEYQAWVMPTNYYESITDVRNGLAVGRYFMSHNYDSYLRLSPTNAALPGQSFDDVHSNATIDKESNIVSDSHYWKKNGDNYTAKTYPRTTPTSGYTSSAVLRQNISGVEKTWHIITPGLAVSENVSENGGDFRKATKRFGQNKLRAITRQGWIFNQENKVWTGEKWETLLEILGPSYTHAELLSGGNRLAINDEGLAIAKIQKAGQPMKIGLLIPVEIDGDNDDDGDIDQADRQAREKHPIVLQRKRNKSDTARTIVVREIPLPSIPIKLVKTGIEKIIIKSKLTGGVLMSEAQSESIDIGPFVSQSDYEITLEGVENGQGGIGLKIGEAEVTAELMPIRVLNADVIFRNGSNNLASLIANNVTHGGFDSGDDNIHDIGGSGIQTITLSQFYSVAVTPTKRRVIFRQTNYMAGRVWEKIFDNMLGQKFDNPTGAKPWNLFTTSDNYVTSNCLEWLHHQWQRSVREVYGELQNAQQKTAFESAYFDGSDVKSLVLPDLIKTIAGNVGIPQAYVAALVTAADLLGKSEINKDVFHNHFEGDFVYFYLGYYGTPINQVPWWATVGLDLQTEGQLRTITPKSYFDSTLFEEVAY